MTDLLSKEAVADIYTAVVHAEAQQDDDARLSAGFEVELLLEQHGGYHGVMRRLIDMMRTNERELVRRREAADNPVYQVAYDGGWHDVEEHIYRQGVEDQRETRVVYLSAPLTSAERERLAELEAKVARLPADWEKDSSLETWFPLTAERLVAYDRAAEKPVATIDIQSGRPDGKKFALVYSSDMHALPDDVYHLFTTVPLTSAERERLAAYDRASKEPVAWRSDRHGPNAYVVTLSKSVADSWHDKGWEMTPLFTAPPLPVVPQTLLRDLVDVVWQEAKESTEVPSTKWADELIGQVFPAARVLTVVLDEEKLREAFEKWCPANIERNKWHPEFYAHLPAREQWAAWESCRAAMLQSVDGNKGAE